MMYWNRNVRRTKTPNETFRFLFFLALRNRLLNYEKKIDLLQAQDDILDILECTLCILGQKKKMEHIDMSLVACANRSKQHTAAPGLTYVIDRRTSGRMSMSTSKRLFQHWWHKGWGRWLGPQGGNGKEE